MKILEYILSFFKKTDIEKALEKCGGDCIPMRKGDE
jgi:hypothetical protein